MEREYDYMADEEYNDELEINESVDEYLDKLDQGRMEWDRLIYDMYPTENEYVETEIRQPKVHRDTDVVQVWMRQQRRENGDS